MVLDLVVFVLGSGNLFNGDSILIVFEFENLFIDRISLTFVSAL